MNKKFFVVIITGIIIIPLLLFFFKPEVSLKGKYVKLSWAKSSRDVNKAFKEKKPEEVIKKIYDQSGILTNTENFSNKIKTRITRYIRYSRNKISVFLKKWKQFISFIKPVGI